LDLSRHRSASLTRELVEWADVALTMSASHLPAIWALGGAGKGSPITDFAAGREAHGLDAAGVPDPMGGDDEEYEATFRELDALATAVLERLAPMLAP
jgi:protein-tyrosine-phosphatase